MSRALFPLNCLLCVLYSTASSAWGYQGHRVVGSVADQPLNDNAKQQVSDLLGFELRIAGRWADCLKSVVRNDNDTFTYMEDPRHPQYEIPCTSFRTPTEQKRCEQGYAALPDGICVLNNEQNPARPPQDSCGVARTGGLQSALRATKSRAPDSACTWLLPPVASLRPLLCPSGGAVS
jgi:S1/P1 Nuclease